ncbi:MBL fold metallo-hydrolase [Agrococcus carbonis]|uniref:Hydroxyacylglutathione hydrolase n=1 Tax=Agrococcus carbonis TaxID=684552 RepID=A0A1H1NBU0_9MICO|nr:MBL fold metallo-hydrolase [Agrococcus carbonis]SDR96392.1 hydroxyacylglutathione hydrolase [Agrococcus carbonis]
MLLERIYDEDLAQASYLIGCQATGEAIAVDPRRDVAEMLALAERHGLRIAHVTETHIHADYLSGTRELAARTGARMHVSDEGGPEWRYGVGFDEAERLRHGDTIVVGNVRVQAVHTPGHTPEHLSFLVTDGAQASEPGFLLTGDFVFVGDLGRPDLLDEAAGGVDTRFEGAKQLFASLRDRFLPLPDYVQVLPGHGAGSACGKALGAIAATTVGYERTFAWWAPYLAADDEQGFVEALLTGQPDAHAYFARMKRQNRQGPALLGDRAPLPERSAEEVRALLDADAAVLVDTRDHRSVHDGTVEGALAIPADTGKTASYGAWVYDPENEHRPLVLLAASADDAERMRDHLVRVGIDRVHGFVRSLDGLELVQPRLVQPEELDGLDDAVLVDVRGRGEHAHGHIPGSLHLSGGRALWRLDELPSDRPVVTYCQSGVRNSIVASALRRAGVDVIELDGSYAGWARATGRTPAVA